MRSITTFNNVPSRFRGHGELVLVTGISGYLGSHVAGCLTAYGYKVRGTVRDLKDPRLKFLKAYPSVELVEADLLSPKTIESAVKGVKFICHVASPYKNVVRKSEATKVLLTPAVEGTKAVLDAAAKHGITRVVLTSSTAAIYGHGGERGTGHVFTEKDWNLTSSISNGPYKLSKRLAEQAGWKFMEEKKPGFDLVVINPSGIFGPLLNDRVDGESAGFILKLMTGRLPGLPNLSFGAVDAHVHALSVPEAAGRRYVCCNETVSVPRIADILRTKFPSLPIPKYVLPNFVVQAAAAFLPGTGWTEMRQQLENSPLFDNTRIKTDLDVNFTPIEKTFEEMGASLIEKGFAK
mmetsp:Transcript_38490/g.62367  ORF Transcript_38490/g.62367 Transcript_38490/m.62367 type:complete len:350 (-) Transcript_38490:460-1509(-)